MDGSGDRKRRMVTAEARAEEEKTAGQSKSVITNEPKHSARNRGARRPVMDVQKSAYATMQIGGLMAGTLLATMALVLGLMGDQCLAQGAGSGAAALQGAAKLAGRAPGATEGGGQAQVAPGPVVVDGKLMRAGKPYRAFGLNVRDLADDILDQGEAATANFDCIRFLGEQKIPFIRFWASYFNNRKKYLADPERYWHNMDLLVDAAEKAGVGLAPTLFWDSWSLGDNFGEFRCDWADPNSQTRKFAERYTREFVNRYKDRPIVWFWEFSNENNLMWDLPNAMEFMRGNRKDARNIARFYVGRVAIQTFGQTVRELDAARPISSGCSAPRASQFHQSTQPPNGDVWGKDSPDEGVIAAGWSAPDPLDLLSIHYYSGFNNYDGAGVRQGLAGYMATAAKLHRALYIGEFGVLDAKGKLDDGFDDALYQERARDMFEAIYESGTPMAAWWVYSVKSSGFGMGVVNPAYGRFDFICELIREYNEKLGKETAG
jgi:hypothetical protein